jgi:hypothetical protein
MKRKFPRIMRFILPLMAILAFSAASCGGDDDSLGTKIVFAEISDGTDLQKYTTQLTAYMAQYGYKHHVEIKKMSAADAKVGMAVGKDAEGNDLPGKVHVAITSGPLSGTGIFDYGTLYTDGDGNEFNKTGADNLAETAPGFARTLRKMNIPMKRLDSLLEWVEKYDPNKTYKVSIYYYWEYDYTDTDWRMWLGGEFDPFDGIRHPTQSVTRMMRGTPYRAEDKGGDLVCPTPPEPTIACTD